MANILRMGATMASYLVSEAKSMYRSRDEGMFKNGATAVEAGLIVAQLTQGAATIAHKAGNVGNATFSAVTTTSAAKVGVYTLDFLTATTFNVIRPDGVLLSPGTVGSAYVGEIGFTVTAGVTPMDAADTVLVTVTAAPGLFVPYALSGSDGSQTVAGILYEGADANEINLRTFTRRDSEVNGAHLIYPTGATAGQIKTANEALVAMGIIIR